MALTIISVPKFERHEDGTIETVFEVIHPDGSTESEGQNFTEESLAEFLAPIMGRVSVADLARFALSYCAARNPALDNLQLITGRPFNVDFENANPIRRN